MLDIQKNDAKINVIVILGPTASSKSDTAFRLAEECNAEIISADAFQIYRGMDIGTAKISTLKRKIIPHLMIDIKEPTESYSAHQFAKDAICEMQLIHQREKNIFVVGGSGLYIKALLYGLFDGPSKSDELRQLLFKQAEEKGNLWLHNQLVQVDRQAAMQIHPNNRKRVIRALEVFRLTGLPITQHWENQKQHSQHSMFQFHLIGLTRPKLERNQCINQRCHWMIDNGLLDEVSLLIEQKKCNETHLSMHAIGYRHLMHYLKHGGNLEKTIVQFKKDSRLLAKKQMVFFSRMSSIEWFHPNDFLTIKKTILHVVRISNFFCR